MKVDAGFPSLGLDSNSLTATHYLQSSHLFPPTKKKNERSTKYQVFLLYLMIDKPDNKSQRREWWKEYKSYF